MTSSVIITAPLLIAAIVMAVRFVGCRFDTSGIPGTGGTGTGPTGGPGTGTTPHPPEMTPFTNGAVPYDPWQIPDWCNFIDLFLLGAGGGGSGSRLANGDGGRGGEWTTVTLHRGSDILETVKTITITVGSGGKGGPPLGKAATGGGPTTATAAGATTQTALGGAGGANPGSSTGKGPSPGSMTDSSTGDMFMAGGDQTTPGGKGMQWGGGGGGGALPDGSGGDGADGAAWVVARQN